MTRRDFFGHTSTIIVPKVASCRETKPYPDHHLGNDMSIVTIRVCHLFNLSLSHRPTSTHVGPFQNVEFLNNPARFLEPYHFRVTFECISALKEGVLHCVGRYVLT